MRNKSDFLVSVVVVTCGIKNYVHACLESIQAQTYSQLEVFVIDNSLNPHVAAGIHEHFPKVALCSNTDNLYYGVSLNKGIEMSHGAYVLCLNDDIVLDRDFIRLAIHGFEAGSRIGMVSAKILRSNAKIIDSTGLFLSVWYTARERGYGQVDHSQFAKEEYIFGVSGAAAFYKMAMLNDIRDKYGYFDLRFRMFYEDMDVAWRAQKRGWMAYYVPAAIAYHVRGGSFRPDTGFDKAFARRYLTDELHCDLIKNRYLTIRKNATWIQFFLHCIPILLYDICAWSYVVLFKPKVVRLYRSK